MSKSQELSAQKANLIAEAEKLQVKSRTEALSTEEDAALESAIAGAETLDAEIVQANREERLVETKERSNLPRTPAPKFTAAQYHVGNGNGNDYGRCFAEWMDCGSTGKASPEQAYRLRSAGFPAGQSEIRLPVDWSLANREKRDRQRTYLTKGGSGSGADLLYNDYANLVTERLSYYSPIVGMVDVASTNNGNSEIFYILDDTGMTATYLTASSGTESNPTIPETNIATSSVTINCFDVTSGFQKVSFQELRDAARQIDLPAKVADANAHSFARLIEHDMILGSGNGASGIQGIDNASTALAESPVAAIDNDVVEDLYFSVPTQYRDGCIFMSSSATWGAVRKTMKDDISNSLFGNSRNAEQGPDWDRLKGKPYIVSEFCPASTLYFFNPKMYTLRMVSGETLKMFDERFWPAAAWSSVLSFGGAWRGPASAAAKVAHS